jgi:hypothetical protein
MSGMLSWLAFLAPVALLPRTKNEPKLPEFKRRWWYLNDRLDARPALWSLKHRPGDWERRGSGRYDLIVIHKPSGHRFLAYGGRLLDNRCSCQGHKYQIGQSIKMTRAIAKWVRDHDRPAHLAVNEQFRSHFIVPGEDCGY